MSAKRLRSGAPHAHDGAMQARGGRWWIGVALLSVSCSDGGSTDVVNPGFDGGGTVLPGDDGGTPKSDAGATGMDAGPSCRTVDDCAGPDVCTNAQACRAGHCVVVGGPASCDDGVACTDDTCDATQGRCGHAPNDSRCGHGQYCSSTTSCEDVVPCTADGDCAHVPGDACTGTSTCDTARGRCVRGASHDCSDGDACTVDTCAISGGAPMCAHRPADTASDPANCGACGNVCASGPHQTTTCSGGACMYTCTSGFADTDHMPSNGCECLPGATDAPDLAFADTNCDGIDGDASRAIFVSPNGNDAGDGSMDHPKRTLTAAVTAAAHASPVRSVYAAIGIYAEDLVVPAAVSIYGGYLDARGWVRTRDNVTVVRTGPDGMTVRGVNAAMSLQLVVVQSTAATMPGASAYAVRVVGSSGPVVFEGCALFAGDGASGTAGTAGGRGSDGAAGDRQLD